MLGSPKMKLNIAFIGTAAPAGGATTVTAALTSLNREALEATFGAAEKLESFLYASPPGPAWPCGPDPADWEYLCELALADNRLRRTLEAALAATHHRAVTLNG